MTNATSTTVSPIAPNVPSQKLINYLVKTALADNASPEEAYRKLIESTWERATAVNKRKSPSEIVTNYAEGNTELLERLYVTRTVMSNTLKKMTRGIPQELRWAQSTYYAITIAGIFRPTYGFGSRPAENITTKLADGTTTIGKEDFVRFFVGNDTAYRELPISFLHNDPMATAQHVRKACKNYAEQAEVTARKEQNEEKARLVKQAEDATKALANLIAKQEEQKTKADKKAQKKADGKARAKEFRSTLSV